MVRKQKAGEACDETCRRAQVESLRASSQEPGVSEMVEDWVRILECGSGNLDSGYPPGLIPE